MKNIYVVIGSTGEYSDHVEWPVAAYFSKLKAQKHVLQATTRANELFVTYGKPPLSLWNIKNGENEYDKSMRMDYTGVRYTYWEVPLL